MNKLKLSNLVRAGLQSGSIMLVADCLTQAGIEGKRFTAVSPPDDDEHVTTVCEKENNDCTAVGSATVVVTLYDPWRSLRWAMAGLTLHGPYFFLGFRVVDHTFGVAATTFSTVLKKTATAQFLLFPPYLVALFSYMGWMEGSPNILEKVKQRVPEAFAGGCIYWPIANGINFSMVPSTMRVPYLAASAGFWNSYLSWANAR